MFFSIRALDTNDSKIIADLQAEVVEDIEDKDTYFSADNKELKLLLNKSFAVGVFVGSELVACGFTIDRQAMKEPIEYKSKSNKDIVWEIHHTITKEKYRNKGLQRRVIRELFSQAVEHKADYVIATIHPNNKASEVGFKSCGFIYDSTIKKYNADRMVYVRRGK